jgi:hypothetical protein
MGQSRYNLQESKMKALVLGIATSAVLSSGIGFAQAAQTTHPNTTAPAATAPVGQTTDAPASSADRSGAVSRHDTAAASGNSNQAVATTSANAPAPAKGANSFTSGEAKSRIERNGFSNVSDLKKDDNGVWRGTAQKGGNTTNVWLDYKGNVGEAQ